MPQHEQAWSFERLKWSIAQILFIAWCTSSAYFGLVYSHRLGFTGKQIGIVNSIAPIFNCFVTPLWTIYADKTSRHLPILQLAMLATGWIPVLLFMSPTFYQTIFGLLSCPIAPLIDAAAVCVLGPAKDKYGRQRVFGTIGCGFGGFMVAQVLAATNNALEWPFVFRATFFTVLTVGLPVARLHWGRDPLPIKPKEAEATVPLKAAPAASNKVAPSSAVKSPYAWIFDVESLSLLLSVFVIGMTMATTSTYLPLFLVSYLKADVSILGVCQVFAVLLEIPMFFMSTRIIAVLGVRKTIFLSQLIIIARLGSYVFLSLGVYWALVGELLQGLCFGLFWSAAVKSISDKAPEEYQASAQGVLGAIYNGAGPIIGNFFGGVIMDNGGPYLLWPLLIMCNGGGAFLYATMASVSAMRGPSTGTLPSSSANAHTSQASSSDDISTKGGSTDDLKEVSSASSGVLRTAAVKAEQLQQMSRQSASLLDPQPAETQEEAVAETVIPSSATLHQSPQLDVATSSSLSVNNRSSILKREPSNLN